jgi:hypothetical protein
VVNVQVVPGGQGHIAGLTPTSTPAELQAAAPLIEGFARLH